MPSIDVLKQFDFEAALRRFKRAFEKTGIPAALRRKEFYEKPAEERKRKKAAAIKRNLKKLHKEAEMRKKEQRGRASIKKGRSKKPRQAEKNKQAKE